MLLLEEMRLPSMSYNLNKTIKGSHGLTTEILLNPQKVKKFILSLLSQRKILRISKKLLLQITVLIKTLCLFQTIRLNKRLLCRNLLRDVEHQTRVQCQITRLKNVNLRDNKSSENLSNFTKEGLCPVKQMKLRNEEKLKQVLSGKKNSILCQQTIW